jgi:hypothetical protein
MSQYVSCFPQLLYRNGGFYDGEVPLSDLLETNRGGDAEIEFLSLVTPGEVYLRRDAVIEGPNTDFNENLCKTFFTISERYTAVAASAMVMLSECIVSDSVITIMNSIHMSTIFETYRQNDRPWAKYFNHNIVDSTSVPFYPEIDRIVLYLGSVGSSNYGHWLVDDLSRLAKLDFLLTPVTIIMPRFGDPMDAIRAEAIGLLARGGNLRIEFVDPQVPLRFTKLAYVTPVSYHPFVKSPLAMNFVREFGHRICGKGSSPCGGRLFVIRSALRHRKLLNLDEVSKLLADLGFDTIDV